MTTTGADDLRSSPRTPAGTTAELADGVLLLSRRLHRRFGRAAGFAVVGGIGTVLNLLIMGLLMHFGVHYIPAAVIAAETTILTNFLMQERAVFHSDRHSAHPLKRRFLQSFLFNNAEAALRLPVLWLLVDAAGTAALLAQAGTLAGAFVLRYLFHSRVVYRPRRHPQPSGTVSPEVPPADPRSEPKLRPPP
ncbi:GtrA family protein [Kocuria sp. CPCC 205231]|uniref:GtrA family protein n=1 Tax=Kocuria sp. CPCC 205231 TaxID=3073551 RepID=UPI0034D54949